MMNKNKRIVYLIGGSGLIGSQILKLLSNKYKVINFDIKKNGNNLGKFKPPLKIYANELEQCSILQTLKPVFFKKIFGYFLKQINEAA